MLLYRFLLTLISPMIAIAFLLRLLRGNETWRDITERLGHGAGQPGAIWLHGASNGELTSARPLVEALRKDIPDRPIVVTANTVSGRDMVAGWGSPGLTARLAPVDLRWVLRRFRANWQPSTLIFLENELWPNRIATTQEGPVLCVAARLSQRSARRWNRAPGLGRAVMQAITFLSAQDAESADRFVALGLPRDRLGPVLSLKSGVELAAPDAQDLARLRPIFPHETTLLAASTHEGEEEIVLDAFAKLRETHRDLKLILAPRHPRRAQDVLGLIKTRRLSVAMRSQHEDPTPDMAVYLADTLGEMALWYQLAGISFVGGSLVARGGHTPFEPTQFGSAIVHGPHVENFREIYDILDDADAALMVTTSAQLFDAFCALSPPAKANAQTKRAKDVLAHQDADIESLLAQLRPFL